MDINLSPRHEESIRKRYRAYLLQIGKSPDYHVYDLRYDELLRLPPSHARSFLIKIRRFFDSLDEKGKRILVAEVLEKHRVYPFWFYDENLFTPREFEMKRREVFSYLRREI